jgi:small-conductance mechanosensitive channel
MTVGVIHNHFESRGDGDSPHKKIIELKSLYFIRFVVIVFWSVIFLSIIDMFTPLKDYLNDALSEPYVFGSLSITIGDVLNFLFILLISFMITSLVAFFIDSGQFKSKYIKFPKGIPAAISLVIRYFIIASGIILALSSLGVDLSKFNLMAGALGLGIGFGLQNVISNFVSGLILVFERPILVGDTVEVNNLLGTVKRIGVRSSNISTFDGAEVVVPNSNLISNDLINWTLSSNLKRIEILIGVAYGTDLNTVLKILKETVESHEDVLKTPEPQALFSEFGDSSLNFRLRFWVPFEHGMQAKSDVSVALYNAFEEKGIEIPFPQRDIHIKTIPPEPGENKLTPPE